MNCFEFFPRCFLAKTISGKVEILRFFTHMRETYFKVRFSLPYASYYLKVGKDTTDILYIAFAVKT